jgi:predicted nucleotidyltransferase
MIKRRDILLFLKKNRTDFEKNFNISKIGLIGSFSRNEETPDSDIDLIVEFKSGTLDLMETKEQLKKFIHKRLGRRVDICREKYIKPYYKSRILKDAVFV